MYVLNSVLCGTVLTLSPLLSFLQVFNNLDLLTFYGLTKSAGFYIQYYSVFSVTVTGLDQSVGASAFLIASRFLNNIKMKMFLSNWVKHGAWCIFCMGKWSEPPICLCCYPSWQCNTKQFWISLLSQLQAVFYYRCFKLYLVVKINSDYSYRVFCCCCF